MQREKVDEIYKDQQSKAASISNEEKWYIPGTHTLKNTVSKDATKNSKKKFKISVISASTQFNLERIPQESDGFEPKGPAETSTKKNELQSTDDNVVGRRSFGALNTSGPVRI
ncbi:hypothetical protein AX774_g2321 [Zancudomyces culisetae]|uniref:Uncharacterized protein n=1 Tax=Zancudomyces culisetae TaxID=1213189 RepID=A0A1R1PT70_ZANCU|nr:hypothetical protein AX774_g3927 [Zancudomyces culisetae]OMH84151.1 hypothetical protein AX774_g2321 [Zancudomyces culisetae]|eukprot:OMH82596.1 hypothetical protein AX774_g3927 [Zancudomyces culisetae]